MMLIQIGMPVRMPVGATSRMARHVAVSHLFMAEIERSEHGDCSTTTSSRKKNPSVLALPGVVWLAFMPSFVLGCTAFRSDP